MVSTAARTYLLFMHRWEFAVLWARVDVPPQDTAAVINPLRRSSIQSGNKFRFNYYFSFYETQWFKARLITFFFFDLTVISLFSLPWLDPGLEILGDNYLVIITYSLSSTHSFTRYTTYPVPRGSQGAWSQSQGNLGHWARQHFGWWCRVYPRGIRALAEHLKAPDPLWPCTG